MTEGYTDDDVLWKGWLDGNLCVVLKDGRRLLDETTIKGERVWSDKEARAQKNLHERFAAGEDWQVIKAELDTLTGLRQPA